MKMIKTKHLKVLVLIILVFIIIIIPLFLFDGANSDLISSYIEYFGIIGALGAVVAIYFQMKREKNISEGKFIYSLYESCSNNENMKNIYHKLEDCKNKGCKKDPFSKDGIGYIIDYLTFFETMFLLIKRKIIDIELIDEMFAYRFFIAVHNPFVQKNNLIKYNTYYKNTYRLHKLLVEHRHKTGSEIPFSEYKLDKMDKNYNKIINNDCKA